MIQNRPYTEWSTEQSARWQDAADTFGKHLAEGTHDYALDRLPDSASEEAKVVAKQAVLDALYGVMMVLEGIGLTGWRGMTACSATLTALVLISFVRSVDLICRNTLS